MRRTGIPTLAAALVLVASIARAQEAPAAPPFELLSRFDYWLNASLLTSPDERFDWDANFGGDLDIVDYRTGRATFAADYNVVLGHELRNFDPNQGNYTLDLMGSRRFKYLEVHGRFHHTSRHLSDRFKKNPVDWNDIGVVVTREETRRGVQLRESAWGEKVLKRSFVDYSSIWGVQTSALFTRDTKQTWLGPVTPVATGRLVLTRVDPTIAGRGTQVGVYVEGGTRIDGKKSSMEFFGAVERRVDVMPLEREAKVWVLFGFRLINR